MKTSSTWASLRYLSAMGIAISIIIIVLSVGCSHPTDAELIELYEQNKQQFEELVKLISNDRHLICVTQDYYSIGEGSARFQRSAGSLLSRERWTRYKKLLKRISRGATVCRLQDDSKSDALIVRFTISSRGLVSAGSSKGIKYLSFQPTAVYESLDKGRRAMNDYYGYRHIEGNWYIYYVSSD